MTRSSRVDVDALDDDVTHAMAIIRDRLQPQDDTREDAAICAVEMFVAIALRVMRKTNQSKLRSEAMTVEIQARMDGKPECLGSLRGDRP